MFTGIVSDVGTVTAVTGGREGRRLSIDCTKHTGGDLEFVFQIAAPAIDLDALSQARWELPGLVVRIETNAVGPTVTREGDLVELRYHVTESVAEAPIHFTLWVE